MHLQSLIISTESGKLATGQSFSCSDPEAATARLSLSGAGNFVLQKRCSTHIDCFGKVPVGVAMDPVSWMLLPGSSSGTARWAAICTGGMDVTSQIRGPTKDPAASKACPSGLCRHDSVQQEVVYFVCSYSLPAVQLLALYPDLLLHRS